MATRTEVNIEFIKRLGTETAFQNSEFAKNGRYTQKLAKRDLETNAIFEIHVYHAPGNNHGWTLIATNKEGVDDFQKKIATGIEKSYRDNDWTKQIKDII